MCKLDIRLHLKENHRHRSCWEVALGLGLPRLCRGKEPTCSCRRCRRLSFGGETCQGLFKMFWTHGRNVEKDVEMFFFLSFLRSMIIFSREWKVIQFTEQEGEEGFPCGGDPLLFCIFHVPSLLSNGWEGFACRVQYREAFGFRFFTTF